MGRIFRLLLATAAVVGLITAGLVFARLHDRPFDFSTATRARGIELPGWLTDLKQHDRLVFWSHATLATALRVTRGDPAAEATQWAKAAWYASRGHEITLAARGVRNAAARLDDPGAATAQLCSNARSDRTNRVRRVLTAASIDCAS